MVTHRLASKNHSTLHHQVKKTIVREPIITVDRPVESHFPRSRHTSTNLQMATRLIHALTSKIPTAQHQAHIEMIVAIKTMVEVAGSRWHSANPPRDNAQQLLADTAEDGR